MKRISLFLALFLFFASNTLMARIESGVGFSDFHGEVFVIPGDDPDDFYSADLEAELFVEDEVETRANSGAILSLRDMTTFVMKSNSRVKIGDQSETENRINLLVGHVWVNVKRMIQDGSMDIEMSQAVAGIKGTNITCYSNQDGSENRVKVIRGRARITIKATKEELEAKAGEEIVIKPGGESERQEFNIEEEKQGWDEDVNRLGSALDLGQIPERIRNIIDSESALFERVNNLFQRLVAETEVDGKDVQQMKVLAERLVGAMAENAVVISNMRQRVNEALNAEETTFEERAQLNNLMQDISAATTAQQNYASRIAVMIRFEFTTGALLTEEDLAAAEMLAQEISSIAASVGNTTSALESVRSMLSNPAGQSQDWFRESFDSVMRALNELDELMMQAQELVIENPQNRAAAELVQVIANERRALNTMLRSLRVVEIDPSTLIEMQEIDDLLSDQMVGLQNEISAYNSISGKDEAERRLNSSLRIVSSFARVRRQYSQAQRMYDSTMRSAQSSAHRTSEQEELENYWQNISDRFQQLGIVADELQANINDLESQLNHFLD